MGVGEASEAFCQRALYHVDLYSQAERVKRNDPSTWKFGGHVLHKRVFSYCEYRLSVVRGGGGGRGEGPGAAGCEEDGSVLEGAIFQENSARHDGMAAAPRWFQAVQLPINEIVDRTMCTEFLLFTQLSLLLQREGVAPSGSGPAAPAAPTAAPSAVVSGELRLYATGPPCISCLGVIRQVQLLFPGLQTSVSFGRSQVVR